MIDLIIGFIGYIFVQVGKALLVYLVVAGVKKMFQKLRQRSS